MSRLIVVDGYNLILRSPHLKPGPDRTLREAREKLVNLLSWAVGTGDARFVVVFDGTEEGGPAEPEKGRVEVRFSRPPETADDLIRRVVEDELRRTDRLTVVTSDLEVARHARAMGADVALSDLFITSVVAPPGTEPEKPETVTKKELEEWAELFRGRSSNPDHDEET